MAGRGKDESYLEGSVDARPVGASDGVDLTQGDIMHESESVKNLNYAKKAVT